MVAYNAVATLAGVLDRVPADFRPRITQIFVCDDASEDATYLVGLGYKQAFPDLPLTIIRNPRNLGYGGNQKVGYKLAIENKLDIVVLLHGDGQYAPECLEQMVEPLARGDCDAVLGSRMLVKGAARGGGMPLYKFVGNKVLTRFQNAVLKTSLSEFHSGYRAYSVAALAAIAFERNSDDFNFDTQIIIQLLDARMRIREIPIPTYYGDEISYVNGLRYAKDVSLDVVRYRASKLGFLSGDLRDRQDAVPRETSHEVIVRWLAELAPAARPDARPLGRPARDPPAVVWTSGHRGRRRGQRGRDPGGPRATAARGGRRGRAVRCDRCRRRARARRRPAAATRGAAGAPRVPGASWSRRCRTSATGTRVPGPRSGGSTTTLGACSTAVICGSSHGRASPGCCRRAGSRSAARRRLDCRSRRSPAASGGRCDAWTTSPFASDRRCSATSWSTSASPRSPRT